MCRCHHLLVSLEGLGVKLGVWKELLLTLGYLGMHMWELERIKIHIFLLGFQVRFPSSALSRQRPSLVGKFSFIDLSYHCGRHLLLHPANGVQHRDWKVCSDLRT